MTSSCQEAAKIRGTSLPSLGRHHPAQQSLFTEAAMPQRGRAAITEKHCCRNKTFRGS